MIDWSNLLNLSLNDYGLSIESYLGDYYAPWRTLILGLLVITGLKIWRKWQNR